MKSINLCTLQVRVGKCNLNLKSQGSFALSLQMGKNTSAFSQVKLIKENNVSFNTTLRMNIQKDLLEQQNSSKCRILLHLIRENREKIVIGIATVDVIKQNNQGFKFHQFGQCADCEADIEVSITYSNSFQLGTRSEIAYFHGISSHINDGNELQRSRGKQSFNQDSILDKQEYNILKQSKAISNIDFISSKRTERPSLRFRVKRKSDVNLSRKQKPNFSQCTPQQIITHFESQIQTLQDEIQDRDNWATGIKDLVQELQAQNQLLKEIRIEELAEYEVSNLEEGIMFVSKIVHSKFEASKSMIHETLQTSKLNRSLQSSSQQKVIQKSQISSQQKQPQRSLTQTKSFKGLPNMCENQRIQNIPVIQSRQELQNALTILTGEQKPLSLQQNVKIVQLQQQLFKARQQKQQLYDMGQQLYSQLKKLKDQRDSLNLQLNKANNDSQIMSQYLQQIKDQNNSLKLQLQKYEKLSSTQQMQRLAEQSQDQKNRIKQLERQLKQSVKAIQQFKNDALSAREEIIMKEQEINNYRMKFGELGSMTDVMIKGLKVNIEKTVRPVSAEKHLKTSAEQAKSTTTHSSSSNNLHSLYTHLLQTSISQRKQLQTSLSQFLTSSNTSFSAQSTASFRKQQKLKQLQIQINKMFIELLKNKNQLKNLKQIQKCKGQISKQVEDILFIGNL